MKQYCNTRNLQHPLKNLERNKLEKKSNILLSFYGDDFTGSTDALENISLAGARAVLFTETPTNEQLNAVGELQAIGIAGKTRALSPIEMQDELIPAFSFLKQTGVKHIHYKVCSTFDSSPYMGSIGKAIDCGKQIFNNKQIPILGGMPQLGRYCVFGNLFAQMGTVSQGNIYRLDRHPSMSRHPVTPSDESDLRLHIGKQTNVKIGLIDLLQMTKPVDHWSSILTDEEGILLDALYPEQLATIGEWLDMLAEKGQLFSTGGSGIEAALGSYWNRSGILNQRTEWPEILAAHPLLVVSGSCSPVSRQQIEHACRNGFQEMIVSAESIENSQLVKEDEQKHILDLLLKGNHVIVHTGERKSSILSPEKLGTALGNLAKEAVRKVNIKRVLVSGGDTSSYTARAMEISAVEMIAPLVTGAPLCKAYSSNPSIDGLEVNFKGGQVGGPDYFSIVARGKIN